MSNAQTSHVEPIEQEQPELEQARFSSGPAAWWIVSTLMHVLIIALASLVSMSISFATSDSDEVIMFSPGFIPRPELNEPTEPRKLNIEGILGPRARPTDENSKVESNIEVSEEMKMKAALDDHFETIDPARPNGNTASGVPESHVRFSESSNDEPPGGSSMAGDLDEVIGANGKSGSGHGNGFGVGNDTGNFKGQWGSRSKGGRRLLIMRHRGTPGGDFAAEGALRWLAYHQEADGHWDAVKYGSGQKTDTAITGLALLAFAGAGHSEKVGEYRDNVRRAVNWLKSKQQPNGLIFDSTDAGAHRGIGYPHAIATLGLVEAAGMGGIPETKAAAQRAVNYAIELHQQGEGSEKLGWRYQAKSAGDLSVTGWYVMALKSAKIAGLQVNPAAFEGALKFLDSVAIKDGANDGYGGATHFAYMPGSEHPGSAHRLTAIGALIEQFCGWRKEQTQGAVDWFVNKGGVPNWGANGESVDLYYWYYGSMCAFQQGGDVWKRWNEGMIKALTENQCKTGDDSGSWPIVGEFSSEWGRVGQTALSALCLEVYYRYEKLKN